MVRMRPIKLDDGGLYFWNEQICHDCGAKVGELHQLGCDMEDCPICDCQLISCSEKHFELVEQGKCARVPYIQPIVNCSICGVLFPDMFKVQDSDWDKFVPPRLKHEWICRQCYDELKKMFPEGWRAVK